MKTLPPGGSVFDQRMGSALAAVVWLALGAGCQSPKPGPGADLGGGWLPSQARVAEAQGSGCRARSPGGNWRRLRKGDWLSSGTLVETKLFTRLRLQLYEVGVMVEVKPASLLSLERISYRREGASVVTSTLLDLQQGELAVDGSRLTPGSEFLIRTPQGLTTIPPPAAN